MTLIITGREQALSCAEVESLFGSVDVLSEDAIRVAADKIDISRLGGAIKVAKIIDTPPVEVSNLVTAISEVIKSQTTQAKFNFGISFYGKKPNTKNLGIKIKRQLQQLGCKPRLVQGSSPQLNAATVINNHLTSKGVEILLVDSPSGIFIARTTAVQDINSYSKRDYEKPCRDSKNGMLPPKLSQILINLTNPDTDTTIVDPFCGSGGLLIESALMSINSDGSDLNQKMIDCSRQNLDWLCKEYQLTPSTKLSTIDATTRTYDYEKYSIATEGYLGENFSAIPTKALIFDQRTQLEKLYLDFFTNLSKQKTQPQSVSICAPFWVVDGKKIRLNIIDEITKLGYTYSEFKSVDSRALDYRREGQYTSRQILVFKTN